MDTINEEIDIDESLADTIAPLAPTTKDSLENVAPNQLPYDIINKVPCYQPDHVIDGIVKVYERIGFDDRIGATYLGMAADDKELVIRVAPSDESANAVRVESAFLCRVEADGSDWRHFSQVHRIFQTDDAYHMTLYYRGGPRLDQCFELRGKFSFGTAGRLAADVLNIIRCGHKHGYILRNVNMDCFHYDASNRHLFMADISSIIKDLSKTELRIDEPVAAYLGSLDFAPITHYNGGKVWARHDLESWFYQFVFMVNGGLPWTPLSFDESGEMKKKLMADGGLVVGLPEQFKKMAEIALASGPITEEEYDTLTILTKQVYETIGGITDHEENMDFEREPTPEETPRLVLCRDDE